MFSLDDKTAFAVGQRLTRGEARVAWACLLATAFLVWATIDYAVEGWRGTGGFVARYCWGAAVPLFGLACVVATHGKWKLTLSAVSTFAASAALACMAIMSA